MRSINAFLRQHSRLLLVIALVVGAGLRWWRIGAHGFWYDEALSGLIAGLDAGRILANAAGTDHPPGYYLLLHFWLGLGRSEGIMRSLSALFSLGAIPLVYGLGRWLFDRPTAVLAGLGMALFPFQIYFAQEARMYGLVIFLAAAVTWLFMYAVRSGAGWPLWIGYGLVAAAGLYTHYFVAFLLVGLHMWWLAGWPRYRRGLVRLAVADGLAALLFLPQAGQALTRTQAYLTGGAWQGTPHILSPLTTIYYLLFAHRSPVWLFPIGLFLVLTGLILTAWESRRRAGPGRSAELALWLSLLVPIGIVLLISWLVRPIYLERSFAVASPALVLLLARGAVAAPRLSPTPYLVLALVVPVAFTLGVHLTRPDPAKPPVREAVRLVAAEYRPGDAVLHLQDASFTPAAWYVPHIRHRVIDLPEALWTPESTHRLFGGQVIAWPRAAAGADRLWVVVMPGYTGPAQLAIQQKLEAAYPRLSERDWGAVQLYLYALSE